MKESNILSITHNALSTLTKPLNLKSAYTHEEREGILLGYGESELIFRDNTPKVTEG